MVDRSTTYYLLLVAVAVLTDVAGTWARDLVFPLVEKSETCTLASGEQGRCLDIRSCPAVHEDLEENHPPRCGFNATYPVVCCPESTGTELKDVSAPSVSFECGRNSRKMFNLQCDLGESQILRPRGAFPSASAARPTVTGSHPKPRLRPGIPEEALPDEDTILGCATRRADDSHAPLAAAGGVVMTIAAVGGVDVEKNAWPWMALIGRKMNQGTKWSCGGVLINEQWVLSALHCFADRSITYVIRLGEHDYDDNADGAAHEDFAVAELVVYPGYSHPEAYHDLILVRLATKVTLKTIINPVCLPWGPESSVELSGQKVTLTGWGDTQFFGTPSSVLQEVSMTVFTPSRCVASYSELTHYSKNWPRGIREESICAGDEEGGKDACQGDSGGPIVSRGLSGRYTLAGIVSRGYGCGLKDFPGLYVNLRYPPYLAWIKKVAF
ncbi:clotting factor G beta subunit-like [Panulirus ornatus]|uniref:clotting factor G beta subunit-like n=1 Tax=Panulirus ornatus TaxID=150431 RepID=UPI003A84B85A